MTDTNINGECRSLHHGDKKRLKKKKDIKEYDLFFKPII